MPRKDKTAWGFKSVDAISFGADLIKIFYQDPKDSAVNWLDYNKKTDKFIAHGQLLAPGKVAPKSPISAVTWWAEDTQSYKIRIYYSDPSLILRELYFDDGKIIKTGALDGKNVKLSPRSPITAATFFGDGVPNIRLYIVGSGGNLREWAWGAGGKKEWVMSNIIREADRVHLNFNTRLSCINLTPWSNSSPALRMFGFDFFEGLYEHKWSEGRWGEGVIPEFSFAPINNSFDTVATRTDTGNPRTFVFFAHKLQDGIMERFRIGNVFEAGKQKILLDRIHPFTVVTDPRSGDPDRMHMFLTNGRDFIHFIRTKGSWAEKGVPQVNEGDDFTDVDSIIRSIGAPST